jgi:1-deoxy-D-xylulose-5-phosphate synthase
VLHHLPEGYKSWSGLIADTISEYAESDERIAVITPAMMYGSALDPFFAAHPERSFDCGIAEEHAMTFAASLANSGMRPFIRVYSSFLQRAYDQINHDVCRMDLPVLIGIDRAGLVGADGDTHHGVFDVGILRALPNLILAQPKDANEARDMIYTALHQSHPFAVRYPRGEVFCGDLHEAQEISFNWSVEYSGSDDKCIVMAYGPDVDAIRNKLAVNELPVRLINCRFFKPLDEAMIREAAASGLPVIVYETDMKACGLASAILEYCNDNDISMKLKRMGLSDRYIPQGAANLLKKDDGCDLTSLYEEIMKYCG